ncbi:MAG: xylulose 5-phosphate 3-epimerase [Verrucomicrobia bacterium]|nr:MAG: xylulose 5-phosphate 3-epimerase [Verrucomicrobiota bacterium]
MKVGISYWMFEGGLEGKVPVLEALEQAKGLGYDSIELSIARSGVLTDAVTEAECREIAAAAQKIGIEISSLASIESWSLSPTASDPKVRKAIVEFTRKALQVTMWLGADVYLFIPGGVDVFFLPDAEVIPYDVCYQRVRDAVRKILPTAEKVGVTLALENVWNKFLLSPLEARDFIDSFGSKHVGAYFDVGNVMLTGYPEQWIRILGKRIKRVHIKDFKRSVGTVEGFVDLVDGDVDFAAVKAALSRIGYRKYVTAEILPYAAGRLEKTAAAMRKIFS